MADGTPGAAVGAADRAGNLVGYARVSTRDQTVALQLDALHEARCGRVFEETASGAQRDRPQLAAALDYMRAGDTLVVWKLDRLARSTKQLIETVEGLAQGKRMRCRFCQPTSEHDSSLRNERRSFRNDEPYQPTNWKSLPTCVAPGGWLAVASASAA